MDQQLSTPTQMNPTPVKRQDATKWIVIILLIIATIGTGIAYFIFTSPDKQQPSTLPTSNAEPTASENTRNLAELYGWKKYTNTKRDYSFVYTGMWTLSQPSNDVDFVLKHLSTTEPGIIEGRFLPPGQHTPTYCEENRDDADNCAIYYVTADREIIIDKSKYIETGQTSIFILHPTQGTIVIAITDANFETDKALTTILTTIHFTDEPLLTKLNFCPTSWSEDKKTAVFNGVSFDTKDLDIQSIAKNCQPDNNIPTPTPTIAVKD